MTRLQQDQGYRWHMIKNQDDTIFYTDLNLYPVSPLIRLPNTCMCGKFFGNTRQYGIKRIYKFHSVSLFYIYTFYRDAKPI